MSTQQSNQPSMHAYAVRSSGDGKSFWNRIGAAWSNKDGSFTVMLDSIPLDGRIVCQAIKQDVSDGGDA